MGAARRPARQTLERSRFEGAGLRGEYANNWDQAGLLMNTKVIE